MKAFEKILVPVDFSVHSAEAIRTAVEVSRHSAGSITLIHVYDPVAYAVPDGYVLFPPPEFERLLAALRAQLAEAARLAREAGATNVRTELLRGYAAREIATFATDMNADLIVMGTHGRRGVGHLVLGSVAERVLRLAPCAVLTVKAPKPEKETASG